MLVTPDIVWWGRNFNSALCCPKTTAPVYSQEKHQTRHYPNSYELSLTTKKKTTPKGNQTKCFILWKCFMFYWELGQEITQQTWSWNLDLNYLMNVKYQPNGGKVTNPSVNPMKFISSLDELNPFILIRRDNILKEMKTSGKQKKSHFLCIQHRYT